MFSSQYVADLHIVCAHPIALPGFLRTDSMQYLTALCSSCHAPDHCSVPDMNSRSNIVLLLHVFGLIQQLTYTTDLRPCGLWTELRCRPVNALSEHQWVVTLVAPRSDPACSALCSASLRGGPLPVVPGGN